MKSIYENKWMDGQIPDTRAYYDQRWRNFIMEASHEHNYVEIMYVCSGQCEIEIGSCLKSMKKGDLIFIDVNVAHRLIVPKECHMMNLEFGIMKGESLLDLGDMWHSSSSIQLFMEEKQPFRMLKDEHGLEGVFRKLIVCLEEQDNIQLADQLLVHTFYYQMLNILGRMAESDRERHAGTGAGYVRSALRYLHDHYEEAVMVSDIADNLGVHPNYLQRLFKKNMGMTITSYLNQYRIKKACMLLKSTQLGVADVAEYVGLGNRQYLTRVFKSTMGVSPKDYRQIQKMSE